MPKNRRIQRRKRPGSVMIMVVALLVLLALMGTAWIASVRYDRNSSVQNVSNNTSDELLKGVVDVLASAMDESVRGHDASLDPTMVDAGNTYYRPRTNKMGPEDGYQPGPTYTYFGLDCPMPDATLTSNTANFAFQHAGEYLSSRLPEIRPFGAPAGSNNAVIYWPAISAPLGSERVNLTTPGVGIPDATRWFESPLTKDGRRVAYKRRLGLRPGTVLRQDADGTNHTYPVFAITSDIKLYDPDNNYAEVSGPAYVVAADTDGDGIADAGLWRLPIGQQGGITWYAAIRIVDSNSALNANTAWEWRQTAQNKPEDAGANDNSSSYIPTNLFPTNIDFTWALTSGNAAQQYNNWVNFHFNSNGLNNSMFNATPDPYMNAAPSFNFISYYDALWQQLGARVDNPGLVSNNARYQAFSLGDQVSLASRFVLANPNARSALEMALYDTLVTPSRISPYAAAGSAGFDNVDYTAVKSWFGDNFDFAGYFNGGTSLSRRPLFVTRNGVSNFIAEAKNNMGDNAPGTVLGTYGPPQDPVAVKYDVNTANFQNLTIGYFNVMTGTTQTTPFGQYNPAISVYDGMKFSQTDTNPDGFTFIGPQNGPQNPQCMFRPAMRPNGDHPPAGTAAGAWGAQAQLLLRAHIAANNTVNLREPRPTNQLGPITVRPIALGSAQDPNLRFNCFLYSLKPQPFLTEVYANNDNITNKQQNNVNKNNPNGYVAIELVNPYPFDMRLQNWVIATVDRNQFPDLTITQVAAIPPATIPAARRGQYGYLVIDNNVENDNQAAQWVPSAAKITGTNIVHIKNLHEVLGKEMFIMRPAPSAGNGDPGLAPVDSFDFTGFPKPVKLNDTQYKMHAWHYARANDQATHAWCFVYPGRYDGTQTSRRQQGTQQEDWDVTKDDPAATPEGNDKWRNGSAGGVLIKLGAEDTRATYPRRQVTPIQLANTDTPGPVGSNTFPFGGFARNGDILQVPFIGSYKIYDNTGKLLEMNAISMDAAFAEDTDPSDDMAIGGTEQVGRFCPVCPNNTNGPNDTNSNLANDWDTTSANAYLRWRYRWAMRLFDYLTVQDPYRDTFPNVPPEAAGNAPQVRNADPARPINAQDELEKTVGVQGLININTAPWPILASIPMAYDDKGNVDIGLNRSLAQQIALFRDSDGSAYDAGSGPRGGFRTIYDLYKIPVIWQQVRNQQNKSEPDDAQGDFTPKGTGDTDGVRRDFEEQFLFLTRISNMVTTRSDTFTAYIVIQGWRDAGTPNATLVAQKRLGLIIDRTNLTVRNKTPRMVPFTPQ